ncbi:MAG: cysteine protease [Firmicutes bacterium]|nr:cysteine protease [Bacillota bacterium]
MVDQRAERPGMGWLPDYPDFRDYTPDHQVIKEILGRAKVSAAGQASLPASVDLREWCSPVKDQGSLGSCTANAGAGLVEHFERKAFGRHIDASRLFLYKVTRNLLQSTGDTGSFIRTTMGALVLFGVPPEEYWPYEAADFDREPPAFCYAFAQNYQAIKYYRLDPPGISGELLLKRIKEGLAAGLPQAFGFTVYNSVSQAGESGMIPFPSPGEKILGGHAMAAVGYNDSIKIKNNSRGGVELTGALLVRNSWGSEWGSGGYGWLPYDYVLKGLAIDWWSLVKGEWIDTGNFGL